MLRTRLKRTVIASCVKVQELIGSAQREQMYKKALTFDLRKNGFKVDTNKRFSVGINDENLFYYNLDLIVNEEMIIKIAAHPGELPKEIVTEVLKQQQISDLPVAVVVNFANTELDIRIFENEK
ncbi:MAG: GxxExxY protein [bacterium]